MENLIGQKVINVHRKNNKEGVIVGFESGVNGGTVVRWDGNDFDSYMVTADLALVADWPRRDEKNQTSFVRLTEHLK